MKAWHQYSAQEVLEVGDYYLCKEWVAHVLDGAKGGFMAKLFDAAMVADVDNMNRLMEGFQYEIGIVIWYKTGINPLKIGETKEKHGKSRS